MQDFKTRQERSYGARQVSRVQEQQTTRDSCIRYLPYRLGYCCGLTWVGACQYPRALLILQRRVIRRGARESEDYPAACFCVHVRGSTQTCASGENVLGIVGQHEKFLMFLFSCPYHSLSYGASTSSCWKRADCVENRVSTDGSPALGES